MSKNFEYNVEEEMINAIFDEKGNSFLAFRRVSWNGKDSKLELRKWINSADGTETPNKGFSFLTENGPNELVNTLLDNGFGDTIEVLTRLKEREDFGESIKALYNQSKEYEEEWTDEKYFDPSQLLEE